MVADGSTGHVLVIEDDPLAQRVLKMQLAARGYRVSIGNDGVEGIEAAERIHPDLVVLDLMMPRMSGFEVLERLRAHADLSNLPILVLTASLNGEHRETVLQQLADAYLTKPYAESQLAETIETLLARV